MADGVNATWNNLAVGVVHPISVDRIVSTGTDGSYTGILLIY